MSDIISPEAEPCSRNIGQAVSLKKTQQSQCCQVQDEQYGYDIDFYVLHLS